MAKSKTRVRASRVKPPVSVAMGRSKAVTQPDTFRVCPLGVQFYSPRKLKTFEVLDFNMSVPVTRGTPRAIHCTGVVVHCRPDEQQGRYRIWVQFMDLPQSERERIKCVSKDAHFLCPHCENF